MALTDRKAVGCLVWKLVHFNAMPMAETSPSLGGINRNGRAEGAMAVYRAVTPKPIRPRRQIAAAYFQISFFVQYEVEPAWAKHKNAIAMLRRGHPCESAGRTQKLFCLAR